MSRRVIPGLESPDPVLESEVRTRLDRVEEALRKALEEADSRAPVRHGHLSPRGRREAVPSDARAPVRLLR